MGSTRRDWWVLPLGAGLAAATLACPIARPAVPAEYYDFRFTLQEAVADTVAAELRGDVEAQQRLDDSLTDLAAILLVDSLIVSLDSDAVLWPLAGAVTVALNRTLRSDETAGSVRDAIRNPDGQRQAVDAIVIGLGLALRRARMEGGPGSADRSLRPPRRSTRAAPGR